MDEHFPASPQEEHSENQEQTQAGTSEDLGHYAVDHGDDTVDTQKDDRKAEIMDESAEAFHRRMDALMQEGRDIVVFRGAGTKNGIDPNDLPKAVEKIVASLKDSLNSGRKVAIMFDGDEDNREKPDVGAVFGMVADKFKDNPDVAAIAAQQQSWYYPKEEGGALESATGTPFETFVFPDSTPGGHAALTQSRDLAQYDNYRQVFVGPAGAIAADQLRDLNEKADGHKVQVLTIATHNNSNLTQDFEEKLRVAEESGDTTKADNFKATLKQRDDQPYGMMYTADGFKTEVTIPSTYPNLDLKMDEELIPEFLEMRSKPAQDTYVENKDKAETLAYVGKKDRDAAAKHRKYDVGDGLYAAGGVDRDGRTLGHIRNASNYEEEARSRVRHQQQMAKERDASADKKERKAAHRYDRQDALVQQHVERLKSHLDSIRSDIPNLIEEIEIEREWFPDSRLLEIQVYRDIENMSAEEIVKTYREAAARVNSIGRLLGIIDGVPYA